MLKGRLGLTGWGWTRMMNSMSFEIILALTKFASGMSTCTKCSPLFSETISTFRKRFCCWDLLYYTSKSLIFLRRSDINLFSWFRSFSRFKKWSSKVLSLIHNLFCSIFNDPTAVKFNSISSNLVFKYLMTESGVQFINLISQFLHKSW